MIKRIVKKILFGYKSSQETYVEYLKKKGVKIGENVEIFSPRETVIETLNPHLLEIGNNVSMTGPVTILNHDYSVCVLKKWTRGEILGKQRVTKIGDNVFLGYGCCVLPGTIVGDNTIVGAYAVVSGTLERDSVYAGNPARRICSIEDYYKKIKAHQVKDACEIYNRYKNLNNHKPQKELFHEYFYLFEGMNYEKLPNEFKSKFRDHGNYDETVEFFKKHKPLFSSYEEFCDFVESNNGEQL